MARRSRKLTEEEKAERPWLFQKGKSGNPNGRPKKGQSFSEIANALLTYKQVKMKINGEEEIVDAKVALVNQMIGFAFDSGLEKGARMKAIVELKEWIDGKSKQDVSMNANVSTEKPSLVEMVDVNKLSASEVKTLETILKKTEQIVEK